MKPWTTLVDVEALATRLGDPQLRIVDARFMLADPVAGRAAYEQSHLPGAVYVDLNRDLSDLSRSGQGRHPLPSDERFTQRLGELGLAPDAQVVVYDAGDGSMAAARFWWMLKLLGHEAVAVLDGGLAAWRARALPETSALPEITPQPPYPARFDNTRIVNAADVQARLKEGSGWLIDARATERFSGEVEPIDPVAGHVPGAVNRPYAGQLIEGRFRTAEELRASFSPLLKTQRPEALVLMCGSGVTACHLLLALEHAGLHGARVFAGSWSGWISDPARPVERGSG